MAFLPSDAVLADIEKLAKAERDERQVEGRDTETIGDILRWCTKTKETRGYYKKKGYELFFKPVYLLRLPECSYYKKPEHWDEWRKWCDDHPEYKISPLGPGRRGWSSAINSYIRGATHIVFNEDFEFIDFHYANDGE